MPAEKVQTKEATQKIDRFPFQLVNVRLYEVHTERCEFAEEKPENAVFNFSLMKGNEPLDSTDFGILLAFDGVIPSGEKNGCRLKVSVEGRFATTVNPEVLKSEAIEQFRNLDSSVLLWPYLRQYVQDLTTRLGLGLPPLPTLDVRALLAKGATQTEPA
jgi:preprotein translocase subunit SecB